MPPGRALLHVPPVLLSLHLPTPASSEDLACGQPFAAPLLWGKECVHGS